MQELDAIDKQMIDLLRSDGRRTAPQLAADIGIGRATAYSRLDRLVDDGTIQGFSARVDPKAVGQTVVAMFLVNVEQGQWRDLNAQLRSLTGVEWIGLTAGEYDYMILARAESLDHLRDVALRELQQIEGVRSAQTVVVLDEVDQRHHAIWPTS